MSDVFTEVDEAYRAEQLQKLWKRYGELGPSIEAAVAGYAAEVRGRTFPGPEHVYPMRTKGKSGGG